MASMIEKILNDALNRMPGMCKDPFDDQMNDFMKNLALITLKVSSIRELRSMARSAPEGVLDDEYKKLKGELQVFVSRLEQNVDKWPMDTKPQCSTHKKHDAQPTVADPSKPIILGEF